MATFDYTRVGKNNEKRGVSVFTANLTPADENLASADVVNLGTIPANSVVTKALVMVNTGATGGTQTIALAVGGVSIVAAVAVGTAANVAKGTTTVKKVGGLLTATVGTASLVDGDFDVIVEYTELDVVTGNLTTV